jgi:hypothetical protein
LINHWGQLTPMLIWQLRPWAERGEPPPLPRSRCERRPFYILFWVYEPYRRKRRVACWFWVLPCDHLILAPSTSSDAIEEEEWSHLPAPTAPQDTKYKCYSKECGMPIIKYKFHQIQRPAKPPSHLPLDATGGTRTTKMGKEQWQIITSFLSPLHKQCPKEKLGVPYLRAIVGAPGFPPPPVAGAVSGGWPPVGSRD